STRSAARSLTFRPRAVNHCRTSVASKRGLDPLPETGFGKSLWRDRQLLTVDRVTSAILAISLEVRWIRLVVMRSPEAEHKRHGFHEQRKTSTVSDPVQQPNASA